MKKQITRRNLMQFCAILLLMCFLLCGCQGGAAVSEKVSSTPIHSAASSRAVSSKSVSSAAVSSVPAPSQPEEPKSILKDRTIVSIASHNDRSPIIMLTDDQKVLIQITNYTRMAKAPEEFRFYDRHHYFRDFMGQSDLITEMDDDWMELNLPEPIVAISGAAALGKSGKVYVLYYGYWNFLMEEGVFVTHWPLAEVDPVVTIELSEPVRQICGYNGNYYLITESGKLFVVGNMSVYLQSSQAYEASKKTVQVDFSKWTTPVQAQLPEKVTQVVATDEVICAIGESGKVYYSRVYELYYSFTFKEDIEQEKNWYELGKSVPWSKWEMKPLGLEHISQMGVGSRYYDRKYIAGTVIVLKKDVYFLNDRGELTHWDADFYIWRTYDDPVNGLTNYAKIERQTDSALKASLEKVPLQDSQERFTEIFRCDSRCAVFLTNQNHLYRDLDFSGPQRIAENVSYCIPTLNYTSPYENFDPSEESGIIFLDQNGQMHSEFYAFDDVENIKIQRPNF